MCWAAFCSSPNCCGYASAVWPPRKGQTVHTAINKMIFLTVIVMLTHIISLFNGIIQCFGKLSFIIGFCFTCIFCNIFRTYSASDFVCIENCGSSKSTSWFLIVTWETTKFIFSIFQVQKSSYCDIIFL